MFNEFVFVDPPFRSCHASSIAITKSGLIATWFAGNSEGHKKTGIWISSKVNDKWSKPIEIANGKQLSGRSFPCWNPVLYQRQDDLLYLFYKVGKSPSEWRGKYITSNDNGQSWSNPITLSPGIYGPTKNKPIELVGGDLLFPSSEEIYDCWKVHFETMSNASWKRTEVLDPLELECIQPTLLRHSESIIQALCRSENKIIAETWSYDEGKTWSPLSKTSIINPNSAIDAVSLSNSKHLLVYNNSQKDRSSLALAISEDGKSWENILILEDGDGEYSYPSIIKESETSVHIVYTWNRKSIKYIHLNESDVSSTKCLEQ